MTEANSRPDQDYSTHSLDELKELADIIPWTDLNGSRIIQVERANSYLKEELLAIARIVNTFDNSEFKDPSVRYVIKLDESKLPEERQFILESISTETGITLAALETTLGGKK